MAEKLGTPFMPWQRDAADIALEVDPATGRLAYRQVTLTVPRQSGKTTLILAVAVHRALASGSPQRIVYTAQTRLDARKKWEDDHLPILEHSPFGPAGGRFFRVRKTTGNEAVIFANGSHYGIMSVTKKSGHGPTIDVAFIDEAFAQEDSRLEQSLKPSQITRPQPQTYVVSTAGDDTSVYLRSKVDAGRALCDAGVTGKNAYIEYSAPDRADPADPETWFSCMPALCPDPPCRCGGGKWRHTVTVDAIQADYESMSSEGKLGEFRRAYLNQWLDAIPDEWLVVPQEIWEGLKADPVASGRVAIAADVAPRERAGTIAAAWGRPDGCMDVEVIEHRAGTSWMPKAIKGLAERHNPLAVVIDKAGPAHSLVDELAGMDVEVTCPNAGEVADGCGRFLDAVLDSRTVRHNGDPSLRVAVAGAVRRDLGDRWAWARKAPVVDISPLVAVTLAFWAHDKFADKTYDILRSVG